MVQKIVTFFCCCFLLCWLSSVAFSAESRSNGRWHNIEIGFNVTFPDRVSNQDLALKKISEVGIKHVRIYEVFHGKKGNTYQKRLKMALDTVLRYEMLPMLSISNFPAEVLPSESEQKRIQKQLPRKVASKVSKILRYSNRFPPNDLEQYKIKLQELIYFLFQNYSQDIVTQWIFEIGNEPDAPLYYWGTAEQLKSISLAIIEVFKENGIHNIGGFGMTHHAVFPNENNFLSRTGYSHLMRDSCTSQKKDWFISFHLYKRKNRQIQLGDLGQLNLLPDWIATALNPVMITEWNVSELGYKAEKIFTRPGAWGKNFIDLLIACHRYKVDRLYLFKLMDTPLFSVPQLGAFDIHGEPKNWYSEFIAILQVIQAGYQIRNLMNGAVAIQGKEGNIVILADKKKGVNVPVNYQWVYSPARGKLKQRELAIKAGSWGVFRLDGKNGI